MLSSLGVVGWRDRWFALLVAALGGVLFDFGYSASFEMLINASLPESLAADVARAMAQERGSIMAMDALRTAIYILLAAGAILLFAMGRLSRGVMLAVVGLVAVVDLAWVDMRYLSHSDFTAPRFSRIVASDANRQIMEDKGESGDSEYGVQPLGEPATMLAPATFTARWGAIMGQSLHATRSNR